MKKVCLAIAMVVMGLSAAAQAAPVAVPYVGYLSSDDGTPYDGAVDVVAKLFESADGGEAVTTCTYSELAVEAGVLSFVLADACSPALTDEMLLPEGMWLSVTIDGTTLEPRQQVLSVPYAMQANNAQKLGGEWASEYVTSTELGEAGYAVAKDLADVATSGNYGDLAEAPDLSGYALTEDLQPICFSGSVEDLVDLDISGFVTLEDLANVAVSGAYADLSGTPDLAVYAMTGDLATVALTGEYGDLIGAPELDGFADAQDLADHLDSPHLTGQQVEELTGGEETNLHTHDGILGDGPIPADRLPPDGLDEVSGGALTSTFQYTVSGADLPKTIATSVIEPTTATLEVEEAGSLQGLQVTLGINHGDISELKIILTSPAGTEVVLHDHGTPGGVNLNGSWPDDFDTVEGSLDDFLSENPAGAWTLTIWDDKLTGVVDGTLVSFGMDILVLQSSRLMVAADVDMGGHRIGGLPVPVDGGDAATKEWVEEVLSNQAATSANQTGMAKQGEQTTSLGVHTFCFLTKVSNQDQSGTEAPDFECRVDGSQGGEWTLVSWKESGNGYTICGARCFDWGLEQ